MERDIAHHTHIVTTQKACPSLENPNFFLGFFIVLDNSTFSNRGHENLI
jgi:hypothetical protein